MDFHKIENITLDEVVTGHMADLSIQQKYGVRYLQYWVNVKAGTVFCLVEGPDAETCERVHQMAHGNVACAITEVEMRTYNTFMGDGQRVDEQGLVRNRDDSIDLGYRNILVATVRSITTLNAASRSYTLETPQSVRRQVAGSIRAHNGREVKWPDESSLIAVFNNSTNAVKCGRQIQRELLADVSSPKMVFKIGISCDQPVTEDGAFFNRAIKLARRLIQTAGDNQVLVSALVKELCLDGFESTTEVRCLNTADENFVSNLLDYAEQNLSDNTYSIECLCKDIGISRPQFYRKVTALTGRAPNDFLRDIRLEKAAALLKRRAGNISQIALEVGYSNPSYFSKCFADKFGCMPSEISSRHPAGHL